MLTPLRMSRLLALLLCTLLLVPGSGLAQSLIPGIQIPNFKLPGGFPSPLQQLPAQAEQAAIQAISQAVGKTLGDDLPITLDARTAFPTVAPPVGFNPTVIQCTSSNMNMSLSPGDYTCEVRAYCMMDSVHRPGSGVPYVLAPLGGKQAEAIATLLERGTAAGVPPTTLQVISWSIQASTPLNQMPPEYQQIVRRIVPEYAAGLQGDFLQQIESTYNTFAPIARLPPLDAMLSRMGPAGQAILEIRRSREIIRQNAFNYERLNQQLYDGPPGQEVIRPVVPQPSQWSQVRPGVAAQFVVEQGNLGLNRLNFRVLGRRQTGQLDSGLRLASYSPSPGGNRLLAQGPAIPAEIYLAELIEARLIAYSRGLAAQALTVVASSAGDGNRRPGVIPPPLTGTGGAQAAAGTPNPEDPDESTTKRSSAGSMQRQVEKGQAPKEVDRVDRARFPYEKDQVHFKDGRALNYDGTWKHGSGTVSNQISNWLNSNGWKPPA